MGTNCIHITIRVIFCTEERGRGKGKRWRGGERGEGIMHIT